MTTTGRRKFIKQSVQASLALSIASPVLAAAHQLGSDDQSVYQFSQVALPYGYAALEPWIDAMTMEIHYSKHHAAYVKNVNDAIAAEKISYPTEAAFLANCSKLSMKARNNAGGVYNHNFFWSVMKPNGGGVPTGKVADAIAGAFGSYEKFKEQFTQAAMTRFGSGWAWLVSDNGKLKIGSTPNQDNPLMDVAEVAAIKGTPLLALDVWEHAYYLKYQNKRNEYVANWYNVINWDEVATRL